MDAICGNHGALNPHTSNCVCVDNWSGVFCQLPPPDTTPCVVSSDDARKELGGGDLSCGNWNHFGSCNTAGTCSCGVENAFTGTRCERECLNNSNCGGTNADTPTKSIGTCNKDYRCTCLNGWSGLQCRTAPSNATCDKDVDCGWGGSVNGTCNSDSHKCVCKLDESKQRPIYKGALCETLIWYDGKPCTQDKDCGTGDRCVNMVCMNKDSHVPSKAEQAQTIAVAVISGFFTANNLVTLLAQQTSEKLAGFVAESAISSYLAAQTALKVATQAGDATFKEIAFTLTENMAVKIGAEVAATEVAEATAFAVIREAASIIAKSVFGPLSTFMFALQIFGMIYDLGDKNGLNDQMLQSTLDIIEDQYYNVYNESEQFKQLGITFPREFYPEYTINWRAKLNGDDVQAIFYKDIAKYMGNLTTNSDGLAIIPAFYTEADLKRTELKSNYAAYWTMANGNEQIFDNLVKYGWIMWLGVSLVIAAIVITPTVIYYKNKKLTK